MPRERVNRVQARGAAGGPEAKSQADEGGAGHGQQDGVGGEHEVHFAGEALQHPAQAKGQANAQQAAQQADEDGFDEKLLEDVGLARAHGLHMTAPLTFRVDNLGLIAEGMERLRSAPPSTLAGSPVESVIDLSEGYQGLAGTDALLVATEAGDRVVARPSGTEPKLKCYLEVILPVAEGEPLPWEQAHERLDAIKAAFAEIIGL
mgnify:CR=1 FL=1